MRLRSGKRIGVDMANVENMHGSEEIYTEIGETEGRDEELRNVGEMELEMSDYERMMKLIRDINSKFTKEISNVRKELGNGLETMMEMMEGSETRWKEELETIKSRQEVDRVWMEKKFQEYTKHTEERMSSMKDSGTGVEELSVGDMVKMIDDGWDRIEDNQKRIETLGKLMDDTRINGQKIFEKGQEEMMQKIESLNQKLNEMLCNNDVVLAGHCKEKGQRKVITDNVVEPEKRQSSGDARGNSGDWIDRDSVKEVPLPTFNNETNENPRKFIQDFEAFLDLRGITSRWAKVWFKRAIGINIQDWFEAVGERTESYEQLKDTFLQRYWNHERQAEVVRKFYNTSNYRTSSLSKEQYLLKLFNENRFLDAPLPEKNFVLAISRHFGADLAKQAILSNITRVDEFATMLIACEDVERDQDVVGHYRRENRSSEYVNEQGSKGRADGREDRNAGGGPYRKAQEADRNDWRRGPNQRNDDMRRNCYGRTAEKTSGGQDGGGKDNPSSNLNGARTQL